MILALRAQRDWRLGKEEVNLGKYMPSSYKMRIQGRPSMLDRTGNAALHKLNRKYSRGNRFKGKNRRAARMK